MTAANGHVYHTYWNGGQWVWEDRGTPPGALAQSSPGVGYDSTHDRVQAFVIGNNGNLYDTYWNGSQWVWEGQGIP